MTTAGDDEEPPLGGALDVLRLVWALDHSLQRASRTMQSAHGVTGPQRLAIRIIGRFPGISAGRLARLLHIHPSTLTGILRRLEQHRHVRRHPDPRDARRTLLGLTEEGRGVDAQRDGTIESVVGDALGSMSASDLAAARRVLEGLTGALSGVSATPRRPRRRR